MRFKQQEEKQEDNKQLYSAFTKILQIEEDKLSLIEAAMSYFYMHGNMEYKKFFKHLHQACLKCKLGMQFFLYEVFEEVPERTIHPIKLDSLTEDIKIFELLASAEDEYADEMSKALDIAYDSKDWKSLNYLLNEFEKIDHLCCRATAAVKSGNSLLDLIPCEQPSTDK